MKFENNTYFPGPPLPGDSVAQVMAGCVPEMFRLVLAATKAGLFKGFLERLNQRLNQTRLADVEPPISTTNAQSTIGFNLEALPFVRDVDPFLAGFQGMTPI